LRNSENGDQKKWHISSEPGAKSDELREDRRWEIEDANQKKWFTTVRHPPSPGYRETRRTGHEEVTRDE
jgi:hypothetical protein